MLKPILFNTEMVVAIQAGRKTVTRRLIRRDRNDVIKMACAKGKNFGPFPENEPLPEQLMTWYMTNYPKRPCEVGDVLWVRETWDFIPCVTCGLPCASSPKEIGKTQFCIRPDQMETADGLTDGCFLYRAEGETPVFSNGHRWRPSIHMPRQAARIFLRVKAVYPDRLQESVNVSPRPIKEIEAEGIPIDEECQECVKTYGWPCCIDEESECGLLDDQRGKFADLWDSTIPKKRLDKQGWAADPWVWVIRFERCEEPKECK